MSKKTHVEATEWHKLGDHQMVSQYENYGMSPTMICRLCGRAFHEHGWMPYRDDGFAVHPGDWIVEVVRYADERVAPGTIFACRPEIFAVIRSDFMFVNPGHGTSDDPLPPELPPAHPV